MIILNSWNVNNSAQEKPEAMTTLEGFPAEITLSENLRNFVFRPVETTPGSESKAGAQIGVSGYIAVGETIAFNFGASTIVLTASATPTSGEFWTLPTAPVVVTPSYLAAVVESIASTLSQILSVRNSYIITSGGGSNFGILAKSYGSLFNISVTSSTLSVFYTTVTGTAKYLNQSKIDYSAWATLYVGNEVFANQVYKFLTTEIDSYTLPTNESDVNLSVGVVSDFVVPILPTKRLTPYNGFFVMEVELGDRLLRPYFLVYGDSWREVVNGEKKRFTMGVTPVRWVQLGAADHLRPYDMNQYVWIPNSPTSFKFLSSAPEKEVTYNSHEYLQVICKYSTTTRNFNIEIKCNFYDGTSIIVSKPTLQTGPTPYLFGNISFDVSPLALGLLAIETANLKQIDSYEVKLKWTANGAAVGYSEIKSYKFQRDCNDKSHQIMFLNEFGGWDCLEFRGESQKEIDRSASVINRVLPPNANKSAAINYDLSVNIQTDTTENTTIHSGLLKKEVYDWAAKLFDSPAIYLWNEDLADYEAINVVEYDYGFDTKQGGGSITLTYNRAQNNTITQ